MHQFSRKICVSMIGVVSALMASPQTVAAENTVFTMTCTGDGAEKGSQEKFTCAAEIVPPKSEPNKSLPKAITGINYVFMDVDGSKWEVGTVCPTWVFRNGTWIQIC